MPNKESSIAKLFSSELDVRIANTAGRSGAFFNPFPRGFDWIQTAQDGVQLTYDNAVRKGNHTFLMAAGNRLDLLVKAPTIPGKYNILVQHAVDPADLGGSNPAIPVPLIQVSVTGTPAPGNLTKLIDKDSYPKQPAFLTNITDEDVAGTLNNPRVIQFGTTGPNFPAQVGQAYGQHFKDALDVAKYLKDNLERLTKLTRLFHDTYYDSTLPHWLLGAGPVPCS